jgi:GNAT superfamily N-acetyltransferase
MEIQAFNQSNMDVLAELQPSGWRDIVPAFDFYIKNSFCFPIKVMVDNEIAGIGATIIHHNTAWLAQIIVRPEYRNKGIGKLITQTLVDFSYSKQCDTIYLIATDLGEPVYEKVGFITETEYIFFKDVHADPGWTISEHIKPINESYYEQIAKLDWQVSLEDRWLHISQYFIGGFVYTQDKEIQGYYLPDFGEGLLLANTGEAGIELMKLRLQTKKEAAFPIDNISATQFLHGFDLKEFRKAKRMRLGKKKEWKRANIYNRIGGNLG